MDADALLYAALAFARAEAHWHRATHVILARSGVTIRVVPGDAILPVRHLSGGLLLCTRR